MLNFHTMRGVFKLLTKTSQNFNIEIEDIRNEDIVK